MGKNPVFLLQAIASVLNTALQFFPERIRIQVKHLQRETEASGLEH